MTVDKNTVASYTAPTDAEIQQCKDSQFKVSTSFLTKTAPSHEPEYMYFVDADGYLTRHDIPGATKILGWDSGLEWRTE